MNKKKNFKPNKSKPSSKGCKIKEITSKDKGAKLSINGEITRVMQTSGPTLFQIFDGTGSFILKGFDGKGTRAFPAVNEGDVARAVVEIREFNGALEGEIINLAKMSHHDSVEFKKEVNEILRKNSAPKNTEFMIKSPILDKLKDRMIEAATDIRKAILENRPIIVRHHNDADGYASGLALERAIVPLIQNHHGPGKATWEYYTRSPCSAPFYEIDDSIRDSSRSLSDAAKFSNKMPLVIISDNGSSQEDLFAIQQGKIHGIDFIVIDHHFFEEDVISKEVLVHINPFLVGENGAEFSAGMLCAELARFINEEASIEPIPAMSGMADRIKNPEAIEAYLKIAAKKDYTKEMLHDMANVIDFVSAKLKFMEAREYIDVLFGEPMEKQKALINLMAPYIKSLDKKGLAIAKSFAKQEKIGDKTLQTIIIDEAFPGFGFFPKPGRAVGLLHDDFQKTGVDALITAGIMNTAITLRATDAANFSVHQLIELLHKKLPNAFVEGGGHKNAGSITFIPAMKDEVVKVLKEFIKSR